MDLSDLYLCQQITENVKNTHPPPASGWWWVGVKINQSTHAPNIIVSLGQIKEHWNYVIPFFLKIRHSSAILQNYIQRCPTKIIKKSHEIQG